MQPLYFKKLNKNKKHDSKIWTFFRGNIRFRRTVFCSKWIANVFRKNPFSGSNCVSNEFLTSEKAFKFCVESCQKHRISSEPWGNLEKPGNTFRCVCSLRRAIFVFCFSLDPISMQRFYHDSDQKSPLVLSLAESTKIPNGCQKKHA